MLAAGSPVAADARAADSVPTTGPRWQPGRMRLVPCLLLVPYLLLVRVQLDPRLLPIFSLQMVQLKRVSRWRLERLLLEPQLQVR